MPRCPGLLLKLAGVASAALLVAAPQAALLTHTLEGFLPALAAGLLPGAAMAPLIALLLPLALGHLLAAVARPWRLALLPPAALAVGLAVAALEPALLMALAVLVERPAGTRPATRAAAGRPVPPDAGRADPLSAIAADVDGTLTFDAKGRILAADATAREMLGGDPIGRPLLRYLPRLAAAEPTPDGESAAFAGDLAGGFEVLLGHRVETELQHESSRFRPVELTFGRAHPGDRALGFVRLTDISARAERLAELERLALHDALTGLPNRALFNDRVRQALAQAERQGQPFAVMVLDLDRFKHVNDTLGHQIGDRLLQAVGPRLFRALRKTDTLARLGGDEFAVLLPPVVDGRQAAVTAERLIESLLQPFLIDGMNLDLGLSIGAALYPEHGTDLDTLIHNADLAMYKAKRRRLGYSLFNAEEAEGSARRLALQRDLRGAIDRGDMQVLFQPKVAVAGWAVTGAEALVRWNHPSEGLLAPDEFLPIAENTGLVMPLTLKVLNEVLQAQRSWRHDGIDLVVAINISAKWLKDREFPKILRLLLRNWHGRPEQLMLEVPETAVMLDPAGTLETLDDIARLGVAVVLDHFGTGYSSLPLLQRLPIAALKIDRTFVGDLFEERSASVVVRSIVKLAHGLGLRVIAGGVQSERVADHLAAIGCDEIQGFFVGHPMPAEQLPAWLTGHDERRRVRT